MIRGITFTNGHTAGAARLGACAVQHAHAGTAAPLCVHAADLAGLAGHYVPMHGWQSIERDIKRSAQVFTTDRPIPRPPERSP